MNKAIKGIEKERKRIDKLSNTSQRLRMPERPGALAYRREPLPVIGKIIMITGRR